MPTSRMDEALSRLGMPIPDSALARQARERIADEASPALANHSVRSDAWAVGLAAHDGLTFHGHAPRSGVPQADIVAAAMIEAGILDRIRQAPFDS